VHLKDALGIPVATQLFYESFYDLDDRLAYVIGVKADESEACKRDVEMPAELASGTASRPAGASFVCNSNAQNSYEPIPEHLSVSCAASDTSSEAIDDVDDVVALVDVLDDNLAVLRHSAGFVALWGGGSSRCLELLPWVHQAIRPEFVSWVHTVCSSFLGRPCVDTMRVVLCPPHLMRFRVVLVVTVKCSLLDDSLDYSEFPSDAEVAKFSFSDISWCRARRSESVKQSRRIGRTRPPNAEEAENAEAVQRQRECSVVSSTSFASTRSANILTL